MKFRLHKPTAKKCRIYQMLKRSARGKHLSFHTPGHKLGKWDITELSYSDNLCAPQGCIAEAEREIAELLGAKKSFILTDGSTSGVLSALYAAKKLGAQKIALFEKSHKSVFNGCSLLGLTPLVYGEEKEEELPFPPTMSALKGNFPSLLAQADALFITSPTYYGRVADLREIGEYCKAEGKLLLVDGAHGGHLRFEKDLYAGTYADIWVDGVHKSLPALTQGAVVSAKTQEAATALSEGVSVFRTTSPSYPIMASVEYAVKYPRNEGLEAQVRRWAQEEERIFLAEDWTKVCALFGERAFAVEKELQERGIYAEFCDGNAIEFYLSPATTGKELRALKKQLKRLFAKYPYVEQKSVRHNPAPALLPENGKTEWVALQEAEGKMAASDVGMFPPCTPLIRRGQRIEGEKITLLLSAANAYGTADGKICIYSEEA